jgi:peptidoglycan-N-acetylglucosamine deacetylase
MLLGVLGGGVAASLMTWAVRGRASAVFGPSVWRGNPRRRAIALTFDDGPSESTPDLLEILDRHKARSTFFQCGANVERLPEIASQVSRAGHEIGNHTFSHQRLDFRRSAFIYDELARTQSIIEQATGTKPRLFRAPYGVRWFGLREAQRRLGLLGVMWTAIAQDWRLPAEDVLSRLLKSCAPGAILCLHDGRETRRAPDIRVTLDAVGRLIPEMAARGFTFETVSQILCRQN